MTNKETSAEIRLEDLGKQLLSQAEPIELPIVLEKITEYVKETKNKTYLLYSKELGYFEIFINQDAKDLEKVARFIFEFMVESHFLQFNEEEETVDAVCLGSNVTYIEDEKEVIGLSIWVKTTYFQLIPYDFGVEIVK